LEELILLYYLRIISISIILVSLYLSYLFFIKDIKLINTNIIIEKNQNSKSIINSNITNLNSVEKILTEIYLSIHSKYLKKIHYGKFVIEEKNNLRKFILKISKPSNYIEKITIVEGWSKYQLFKLLENKFKKIKYIEYSDVLADTYFLHSYENFDKFYLKLIHIKKETEQKYKDHKLLKKFTFDQLLIIGSILEKEGINDFDKKIIFSVIYNRLQKKMKLQIDATTIFAITDGKYDLDRLLNFNDLKVKHPYNTYYIKGLPPKPISYVGKKTMELIFENYKSNYLYYFYNNIVKKHIYSKTFKEHKRKLSEYRNKK
jgi:UPF0755 protein